MPPNALEALWRQDPPARDTDEARALAARFAAWTPQRIRHYAASIGPNAEALVDIIMRSRPHPEQGFRSCLGIIRLGKRFGDERLEKACQRAVMIGGYSYKSVRSILERGLDRKGENQTQTQANIAHENIRGDLYYGSVKTRCSEESPSIGPGSYPSGSKRTAIKRNERPLF